MGNCCDPKAPRVYMLKIEGGQVGLTGVEQAFLDVLALRRRTRKQLPRSWCTG